MHDEAEQGDRAGHPGPPRDVPAGPAHCVSPGPARYVSAGPARYVSAGPPTCVACGRFIPEPQAAPPGYDEIVVAPAGGRPLCSNRTHRDLGLVATVTVTFGQLGTLYLLHAALWPETWGCSYPFCDECWDTIRQIAERKRPGLVIRDTTERAQTATGQA